MARLVLLFDARFAGSSPVSSEDQGEDAMQATMNETRESRPAGGAGDARALRILAKSVYRDLKSSGYSRSDIVHFTNALLELVTTEIKSES